MVDASAECVICVLCCAKTVFYITTEGALMDRFVSWTMAKIPVTQPDEKQLKCIFDDINLTPKQLEKDTKMLREWLSCQPHLPQDVLGDKMIELFIIGSKNSLQVAKQKMDMYLSNRSHYPEIYGNRDPTGPEIRADRKVGQFFTLPQMTPECYRVNIARLKDCDPNKYNFLLITKRILNTTDVRLLGGLYQGGEYLVCDFKGITFMHLTKITPSLLKKLIVCGQEAFPARLKGILVINAPPFSESLVTLIKTLLKENLAKRVHVYSGDHTNLYKHIPKDILPYEYGGKAGKMDDLCQAWTEYVETYRDWFIEDGKLIVDESKRPEKSVYKPEQLFGVDGSFKKLSFD